MQIVPIADHPDLGKLTRSNNAPTPPEEKTLQGMISDSGKRIDAIDVHCLRVERDEARTPTVNHRCGQRAGKAG